ncbi:hypothetical protein ACQUFG_17335, partial [Enterococcus gallinarum]|uniref:hypothetical protein n=1 Tax=Enterococcus gallinarum TaxID=1353 RepID=UPI003D129A2D
AELRHHALHLVEVAAGHLGRRRAPVERVLLVDRFYSFLPERRIHGSFLALIRQAEHTHTVAVEVL